MNKEMEKIVSKLVGEFSKLRTDTINTDIVEDIKILYYDDLIPLNQLATVSLIDRRTINIQPWDSSVIRPIEKAILQSNLGVTPYSNDNSIRLNFPSLTTDRRKELIKIASAIAETHRIYIRNIRKDQNNKIKRREDINDGQKRSYSNTVQKDTDDYIERIDMMLEQKSKDIMVI